MNLTLIYISFIVQQITLVYLPNVICRCLVGTKAMLTYVLICVKSSGQCSNTTRALGYASTARTAFIQYCNSPNKIRTA